MQVGRVFPGLVESKAISQLHATNEMQLTFTTCQQLSRSKRDGRSGMGGAGGGPSGGSMGSGRQVFGPGGARAGPPPNVPNSVSRSIYVGSLPGTARSQFTYDLGEVYI
jgi:hypothetical protein